MLERFLLKVNPCFSLLGVALLAHLGNTDKVYIAWAVMMCYNFGNIYIYTKNIKKFKNYLYVTCIYVIIGFYAIFNALMG